MPRSSRHRSHRSHKHGPGDYSGSEDEGKAKGEDLHGDSAGARVSRGLESEKRKPSHTSQEKESHGASNGYAPGEHGRKRKERDKDPDVPDRWKSSGADDLMDEKRSPEQVFGPIDVDKSSKLKHSAEDSKSRSSRRQEGSNQRNEKSGGKIETGKQRSDKDSGWRESGDHRYKEEGTELSRRESGDRFKEERTELNGRDSGDRYKEERERERERKERERGLDKDKYAHDAKHQRSEDTFTRKNVAKSTRNEGHVPGKDIEVTENHVKEELCPPVMEKDSEKHIRRRRNDSEGEDDDRKLYYRDDDHNSRSSKDLRPEGHKYKDKYKDDVDRDRRCRDERRHDDRSSGYHTNDRYDSRNSKNESKSLESRYKKSQFHDKDDYGNPYDGYGAKDKDTRVRKRFSEENEDRGNLKPRNVKEQRQDMEIASSSSRLDYHIERSARGNRQSDKVDCSPSKKHTKSSPTSSSYQGKDQSRHRSRLTDSVNRESLYEETIRPRTSSTAEHTPASRHRERIIESQPLDKFRLKDDVLSHEQTLEVAAASQYDSTLRLDKQSPANQTKDKSPSRSDQRFTGRTGANHSLQTKVGQRNSSTKYKDRESDLSLEKPVLDYCSQSKAGNREPTPVGPSSINRIGNLCGSSPNHLQHPSRIGPYDDDNRFQIGDRRNQYPKRSDLSAGRGHGNAWNNTPAWPPSVANGFLPLPHGPPSGFHPAVQQFPGPPLYGVRPPMQFSGPGIPYHMHDAVDRFSGHVRAYGWPNLVDDSCPPPLQVWDGSTSIYGGQSHLYVRPEWDRTRPFTGNGGWEMSADTWRAQDNMNNIEFPVPPKELELERPAVNVEANSDKSRVKSVSKSPSKVKHEKKTESLKLSCGGGDTSFCRNYLSRINISDDLAGPELYVRCTAIVEPLCKNGPPGVLSDGCPQALIDQTSGDVKEEHGAKSQGTSNGLLYSLFSSNGHSVFQRAKSLYKKQTATPFRLEGKNNLSEVHNPQKGAAVNSDPNPSMEEVEPSEITDPSSAGIENMSQAMLPDPADDVAEEQKMATDAGGDHPVDAEEQQSGLLVGDGSIDFNIGSQDHEAIVTEPVNWSRIP